MKILIAPNAFKESLGAPEAARAIARGLRRALPDAEIIESPVADGGDGTAAALLAAVGGSRKTRVVTGPLGESVKAPLIRLKSENDPAAPATWVVEMARSSGLALVPPGRRNPMKTTTRGLGELIAAARSGGARRIIIGIGGSATVDGAAGAAQALGFHLLDARGREIPPGGEGLARLRRVIPAEDWLSPDAPELIIACDVSNPLLGPQGAAAVFGPQKGATRAMIPKLEAGLKNLIEIVERDVVGPRRARQGSGAPGRGQPLDRIWGGGAAGGAGAGLVGFLGARIIPGAELVLDLSGFNAKLQGADYVITGEGRLDTQTLGGKAPSVVARAAARAGAKTIGLAGSVDPALAASPDRLDKAGFAACFSITPGPMPLDSAMADARKLIETAAFQIGRLLASQKD